MTSLSLPAPLQRYIDGWIESRNPPSRDAITLHHKRLYILPTRFGYLFAMMLMFLFLAAINYQNSMAFVLTFMLTALGIISLWYAHKNLLGVSARLLTPRPVFCGEHCELHFELSHPNQVTRYAIGVQYADLPPAYVRLEPAGSNIAAIRLPTHRRGRFRPGRVTLFTRYPTGLFHAWSWLQFEQPLLVYPRPLEKARLQQSLVEQHEGQTATSTIEGDDFAGLREHRVGESLRHVSWKAYAQGKGLLTKTFQGHARPSLWIDWNLLTQGTQEHKLSFMAALVLAAESEQQKYGLRLPGTTVEQSLGNAHKHECLHALATFRLGGDDPEFPLESD